MIEDFKKQLDDDYKHVIQGKLSKEEAYKYLSERYNIETLIEFNTTTLPLMQEFNVANLNNLNIEKIEELAKKNTHYISKLEELLKKVTKNGNIS